MSADPWALAYTEAAQLLAQIQAAGQTPYLWADGVRAGTVLATVTGPKVRSQGPPIPPGPRIGGGGL